MGRVTVYSDKADEWRWNRASGSDVVADSGEGYAEKATALEQARKNSQDGDTLIVREKDGTEVQLGIVGDGGEVA